jgi:hypothetical protein
MVNQDVDPNYPKLQRTPILAVGNEISKKEAGSFVTSNLAKLLDPMTQQIPF